MYDECYFVKYMSYINLKVLIVCKLLEDMYIKAVNLDYITFFNDIFLQN
jgi:hypothetical protein